MCPSRLCSSPLVLLPLLIFPVPTFTAEYLILHQPLFRMASSSKYLPYAIPTSYYIQTNSHTLT